MSAMLQNELNLVTNQHFQFTFSENVTDFMIRLILYRKMAISKI